jgi:hypothetical protein
MTKAASVTLLSYDIAGREVKTLIDDMQFNPGIVKAIFDSTGLA